MKSKRQRIREKISKYSYSSLLERHRADYKQFYDRVVSEPGQSADGKKPASAETKLNVHPDHGLSELIFQFWPLSRSADPAPQAPVTCESGTNRWAAVEQQWSISIRK